MRRTLSTAFLALFAFAALAGPALAAPAVAVPPPSASRTLTVAGDGEVKAVPDQAILTAGVVTQAASANDALAANRRAMNNVFAELKRQGIPDRSIRTSQFNVNPQYENTQTAGTPPRIIGYQVTNDVTVTVDDLSKLGPAIDALVASGANSMGGISFAIKDPKPLLRQAREAAIRDARDRAETYARAAGVTLGAVTEISEGVAESPRPMFRAMAVMAPAQATPIAAGEQSVTAQVTMTFEIR